MSDTETISDGEITAVGTVPVVSVITPFYNSIDTLARCIESVLAQTFADFEYILADNCSADGSGDIARHYAAKDPRIRYVQCSEHLPQRENYNRALRGITGTTTYCKIVQADDLLYPRCLEVMMELARRHPTAGIISSVRDIDGLADPQNANSIGEFCKGAHICQTTLRGDPYAFGSPTTVMYRADLVRDRFKFYRTEAFFDDTDAALDLLRDSDFAFSQEVLSHTVRDPNSTFGRVISYDASLLYRFMTVHRIGDLFFSGAELADLKEQLGRQYYDQLLYSIVRRSDRRPYLAFHRSVLNDSAGMRISLTKLARAFFRRAAASIGGRIGFREAQFPAKSGQF